MQDKIKAIIVDDEPGCIANLRYYLTNYCPAIEIVGTAGSAREIAGLLQQQFDIAFMDIELQRNNIFSLLSNHSHANFDIVFVTAFEQYALKAFNVPVLDYILKPLSRKSILACYEKIRNRYAKWELISNKAEHLPLPAPAVSEKVVLRHNANVYIVSFRDIVYLEAHGVYTKIHFLYSGKLVTIIVSKPIGYLEQFYPGDYFFRVHHSFIVNREKIKGMLKKNTLQIIMCTDCIIPVARRRIADFCLYMNIEL